MEMNAMESELSDVSAVLSPTTFPCGRHLPNRLVKVALYEHLAYMFGGLPNENHLSLYRLWADAGWGMIITGNVQVLGDHLSLGRDLVVPNVVSQGTIRPFARLATAIHGNGEDIKASSAPLAIMQLSHAGRQSANLIGGRAPFSPPLAPSAVPLRFTHNGGLVGRLLHSFMFQTPREMSSADIEKVLDAFVRGGELASLSGFDGIELHAGHGYLLSQFMDPKTNLRTDEYSARQNGLALLHKIISGIRASENIAADFVVGIKLNAADYIHQSREDIDQSETDEGLHLQHIKEIASWDMVDFIEVSGGNYVDPVFMTTPRGSPRQALFADFSKRAMQALQAEDATPGSHRPLILLTGGFRTPELLSSALAQKHADLLGVGRLSVVCPDLPQRLASIRGGDHISLPQDFTSSSFHSQMEESVSNILYSFWNFIPATFRFRFPRLVGSGMEMAQYNVAMRSLAYGRCPPDTSKGLFAVIRMWLYLAPKSKQTYSVEIQSISGTMVGIYVISTVLISWALVILLRSQ